MPRFKACCIQIPAYGIEDPVDHWPQVLGLVDDALKLRPQVIVLPECTYPAYFLRSRSALARKAPLPVSEALDAISRRAARSRCLIAVGLVEQEGDELYNTAFLLGPKGELVGRCRKRFLWHFDSRWFSPGAGYETFDTPLGRLGMLICADGRLPEIARMLALDGAQVLLNPTAWVTSGATAAQLSNPQLDFLMPTRALENSVWVIAANKHGVEAQSIVYCGKSCIIDPAGRRRAVASTDRTQIIAAEVDTDQASPVAALRDRRPGAYALLTRPTPRLPAFRNLSASARPGDTICVSVLQMDASDPGRYIAQIEAMGDTLALQDVDLAVCPALRPGPAVLQAHGDGRYEETLCRVGRVAARTQIAYLVAVLERAEGRLYRAAALVSPDGLIQSYRQVHLAADERGVFEPGPSLTNVWRVKGARVGVLMARDLYFPESARCVMLAGAEIIVWMNHSVRYHDTTFLCARALENRVFIAHADSVSARKAGRSAIVGPDGRPMVRALRDRSLAICAQIPYPSARQKEMAPNTDALLGRAPQDYGPLARREHPRDRA